MEFFVKSSATGYFWKQHGTGTTPSFKRAYLYSSDKFPGSDILDKAKANGVVILPVPAGRYTSE